MKIYDISVGLSPSLPFFPGDPVLRQSEHYEIANGDTVNVSRIDMGTHTGTHIDAPRHFFAGGAAVDELPLSRFLGPAKVVDLTGRAVITGRDLAGLDIKAGDNLLFKTDNAGKVRRGPFCKEYVALDGTAGKLLAEKRINLVGIDYLSIENDRDGSFTAHRALLGAGVIILEGVDLSEVPAGEYEMIAFPISLPGGNGSPVRAVLISRE